MIQCGKWQQKVTIKNSSSFYYYDRGGGVGPTTNYFGIFTLAFPQGKAKVLILPQWFSHSHLTEQAVTRP